MKPFKFLMNYTAFLTTNELESDAASYVKYIAGVFYLEVVVAGNDMDDNTFQFTITDHSGQIIDLPRRDNLQFSDDQGQAGEYSDSPALQELLDDRDMITEMYPAVVSLIEIGITCSHVKALRRVNVRNLMNAANLRGVPPNDMLEIINYITGKTDAPDYQDANVRQAINNNAFLRYHTAWLS